MQGKRLALPHSRVMIHQPMGGAQGQAEDIKVGRMQMRGRRGKWVCVWGGGGEEMRRESEGRKGREGGVSSNTFVVGLLSNLPRLSLKLGLKSCSRCWTGEGRASRVFVCQESCCSFLLFFVVVGGRRKGSRRCCCLAPY